MPANASWWPAGNSAVQVGYELAQVATVTLATRHPVTFHPQRRGGQDLHHWLVTSGFDLLPPQWLSHYLSDRWVVDTGKYRHALETGQMDRRPMFTAFGTDGVIWPDGTTEKVDTVVFATGYRPHLGYLNPLGALDGGGLPLHSGGISATHPGLVYSGWSSSSRSPPTPCAACTATPNMSSPRWPPTCATPQPPSACNSRRADQEIRRAQHPRCGVCGQRHRHAAALRGRHATAGAPAQLLRWRLDRRGLHPAGHLRLRTEEGLN